MHRLALPFLAAVFLLAGCGTTGSGVRWYNPATWMSGSEGRAIDRAEVKRDEARDQVLKAAQAAAHETQVALASAPPSRPVEVASESADHTAALLDQVAGPMPSAELAALRERVAKLLSENAAIRAAGELERNAARAESHRQSARLADLERDLTAAQAALRTAFGRENALANELRNERWWSWFWRISIGTFALIAFAGWIYVRLTLGGLPTALGRTINDLKTEAPQLLQSVRPYLDVNLTRSEQALVRHLTEARAE